MTFIETYYLIDYENVGSDGLSGCDKLNETDHIHLFYTEKNKKIDLDIVHNHGEAEFIPHKVSAGNQSLDKHLVSFLGYIMGINQGQDCNYIIVSKDKGYDNVIKFWKEEDETKLSRVEKINQPAAKQKTTDKQPTAKKASPAKSQTKADRANKIKLNSEVQQALSKARYKDDVISSVAKIVVSCFGKESFLVDVHNALEKKYENYLDVYGTIKDVIGKYAPAVKIISKQTNTVSNQDHTALNAEIQQILSKAGMKSEVINDVASIVVKNVDVKNNKQQIYRSIMKKYGQQRGLDIYTRIKKHIP